MTPSMLQKALKVALKANVPAFIWGIAGIGKSEIVKQTCKELGMQYVDLRLATQEVGDLTGVPYTDVLTNRTHWGKPDWWLDDKEWVLFLDEVNRANPEVIQAVFQLVLDRMLHTHKLPSGVRIVAGGNPPEGQYTTNALDPALYSRFMHLKLDPSPPDWIENCASFINGNVLSYIGNTPAHLCNLESSFDINSIAHACPRTWEFVGRIHETMEDELSTNQGRTLFTICLTGLVGAAFAGDYIQHMIREWTNPLEILNGTKTFRDISQDRADVMRLTIIIPQFLAHTKTDKTFNMGPVNAKNLTTFVLDLLDQSDDLGMSMVKRIQAHAPPEVGNAIIQSPKLIKALVRATAQDK